MTILTSQISLILIPQKHVQQSPCGLMQWKRSRDTVNLQTRHQ